ncbi:MAG: gluconate 2-dehydrogenase subunit 3 family protein [Gemmatimonadales bacterium]|nr:gluconate 2-dehydrogenase subunit 3 family protein [Gemmatimonadales bacterium]
MDRRDVLRLLGGAFGASALDALAPDRLAALGREAHAWAAARATGALDPHQRETVAAIAELIMPATDTPGARAAGVPEFIEVIVGDWYHDDERAAFMRGLADVDSRSEAAFGRTFVALVEAEQAAILTGMDAEARAMPRGAPQHFFARIKGLTLYGYYTSEIGVTQELGEVFMPGRYDGAAPVRAAAPPPAGR